MFIFTKTLRNEVIFHIMPSCAAPLWSMLPIITLLLESASSNLLRVLNPKILVHSHMQSDWDHLLRRGSCLHLDTLVTSRYSHDLQPSLAEWSPLLSANQHLYPPLRPTSKRFLCLPSNKRNGVLTYRTRLRHWSKVRVIKWYLNILCYQ